MMGKIALRGSETGFPDTRICSLINGGGTYHNKSFTHFFCDSDWSTA